jgi:type II secretory pathway pseudopilin PulG
MNMSLRNDRGMSLVEATIILMVLAVLTGVLTQSVGDYVNDARHTKAKEDVEALGTGIVRMLRDIGKPFPQIAPGTNLTYTNRVDLLVSEGAVPSASAATGTAQSTSGSNYYVALGLDWDDPTSQAGVESATDHLVTNVAAYTDVTFPAAGGPRPGLGWRGGYLSTNTGPDPWGTRYACTTVWLNPGSDSSVKGTPKDAYCLSASGDGNVDTDMDGNGSGVGGGGGDPV